MTDAKTFWNNCHSKELKESICGFYENGKYFTTFERTIEFLQLKPYIKPGLHVLEIGVGIGKTTKGFYDKGLIVSGLDVSDVALSKVKRYCENVYTTSELDKLPSDYFDIIICNRVVQHVPTDLLIEELKHCMRSLKNDGIFAIQFVSNDVKEDMGLNCSIHNIKAGTCCRTPEYLEKLISRFGGECELVFDAVSGTGVVKKNHVFHVRKIDNV